MAEAGPFAGAVSNSRGARVALASDDDGLHLVLSLTLPPPRHILTSATRRVRSFARACSSAFLPLPWPIFVGVLALCVGVLLAAPPESSLRSGPLASALWAWAARVAPARTAALPLALRVGCLAACVCGCCWLLVELALARCLRLLLSNHAYMYAGRTPSLFVRAWTIVVRWLTHARVRPSTFAFQACLPTLPLPALRSTVARYLESQSVLLAGDPVALARTRAAATAFLAGEGPALQRVLWLHWMLHKNYVTAWWTRYVYLSSRLSLAINSSYYALDSGYSQATKIQAARAAVLIHGFSRYASRLDDDDIPPVLIAQGIVPLCMKQTRLLFRTTRVPGRECDELRRAPPERSRHVALRCSGRFYKLNLFSEEGYPCGPDELEDAVAAIQRDARTASTAAPPPEAALAALTTLGRTRWAEVRECFFTEGTNRRSLAAIEEALFYVSLTDDTFAQEDWTARGARLLCGDRTHPDLWLDKSLSLVIDASARAGLNVEHSFADAPIVGAAWETVLLLYEHLLSPYDAEGHVLQLGGGRHWSERIEKGEQLASAARESAALPAAEARSPHPEGSPATDVDASASLATPLSGGVSGVEDAVERSPSVVESTSSMQEPLGSPAVLTTTTDAGSSLLRPRRPHAVSAAKPAALAWSRLSWTLPAPLTLDLAAAVQTHQQACDDLHLEVGCFPSYGKDFIKRCHVSPDAFIQGAFQLAYLRDCGRHDATYESSTTRLFAEGRTETVRPLTREMVEWVAAMLDASAGPRERLRALQTAAARHVAGFTDAMTGQGIDRHLFALLIASVGRGVDSPFLRAAMSQPWRLSTSQQPQQQSHYWPRSAAECRRLVSPGGGFGPVSRDGYGVSYMVSGVDSELFFHVSSIRSCPETDSGRFLRGIMQALRDMRASFEGPVAEDEAAKRERRP